MVGLVGDVLDGSDVQLGRTPASEGVEVVRCERLRREEDVGEEGRVDTAELGRRSARQGSDVQRVDVGAAADGNPA